MTETNPAPASPPPPPAAPSPPDRTMAWLAHLLLLFTWFIGPLVIWLTKKDQDKYAAFHAKQALCWAVAVTIVFVGLSVFSAMLAFLAGPLAFFGTCLIWLLGLGNTAYIIVATVFTSQGKVFKYVLVADQFCKKEFAEAYPAAAP